jgi:hypothetical protein
MDIAALVLLCVAAFVATVVLIRKEATIKSLREEMVDSWDVRAEMRATITDLEEKVMTAKNERDFERMAKAHPPTDIDLTRQSLGLVTSKEGVEALEQKFTGDKDAMKQVGMMWELPAFHALIDVAILTFKDKLAAESHGREADLLNRGAMYGAGLVKSVAMEAMSRFNMMNATAEPLKGIKKHKTMTE